VGLSRSFPEPEKSGAPQTVCTSRKVVSPSCFDVRPTVMSGRDVGGQQTGGSGCDGGMVVPKGGRFVTVFGSERCWT
jgi:hypothetical protein